MHVINALRHFMAQLEANEIERRRKLAQDPEANSAPPMWILHAR